MEIARPLSQEVTRNSEMKLPSTLMHQSAFHLAVFHLPDIAKRSLLRTRAITVTPRQTPIGKSILFSIKLRMYSSKAELETSSKLL